MAELDDVPLLPIVAPETVQIGVIGPVDRDAEATARQCLADLKAEGEAALRRYAEKFGDIVEGGALVLDKAAMKAAFDTLSTDDQVCLENTAKRGSQAPPASM